MNASFLIRAWYDEERERARALSSATCCRYLLSDLFRDRASRGMNLDVGDLCLRATKSIVSGGSRNRRRVTAEGKIGGEFFELIGNSFDRTGRFVGRGPQIVRDSRRCPFAVVPCNKSLLSFFCAFTPQLLAKGKCDPTLIILSIYKGGKKKRKDISFPPPRPAPQDERRPSRSDQRQPSFSPRPDFGLT